MDNAWHPTPHADVNVALGELLAQMQSILGARLTGVYLSGSLALGDFDPHGSDIDLVVVTASALGEEVIAALSLMHARFDAGDSPWAGKIEAIYVTPDALRGKPDTTHYPQVEKERGLFLEQLEDGWLAHCYTVREHGIVLAGPDPKRLIDPVDSVAMRCMVARIPEMWRNEAQNDPSWLAWLRTRSNQSFVVLTLCRLLYTLEEGAVASKPAAARWAQQWLDARWSGLIERALAGRYDSTPAPEADVTETVALVELTSGKFRAWQAAQG